MKANMEDYKKEIHRMVDEIKELPRIIRIYSYIKKVFLIHNQETEED
ncbi:MAG: hypothetical protein HDQ97_19420 [Lachnospiraceae bacterium]|nr:hypothetical protein [Lachnospiraceae bacterium]